MCFHRFITGVHLFKSKEERKMKKMLSVFCLCACVMGVQAQSHGTYKEYVRRALEAISDDKTEDAEELFREAMKAEPAQRSNAMIYYQIGRIQEHRGKPRKALQSYTQGLNIAPHVLPLRMARARLYMEMGNQEKALVDYSDVLDWKEDEEEALFMRAYIYTGQRLYKKARADYEALLKLNPAHEEARIGLVLLNEKDNRPREAMEQINAMIAAAPDHAVLYAVRAGLEQTRKQYEASEADFTKAITLDPSNIDYLLNRAALYAEIGETKKARADLDKALELGANPEDVASMRHQLR